MAASRLQALDVAGIQADKKFADSPIESRLLEEVSVCVRRDRESVRNPHALGGEFTIHFTQRSVLAPHGRDIANADVGKPANVLL